jgi:hypothetical protein
VEAASVDWGLSGKAVIVGRDVNRLGEQAGATQAAGGRLSPLSHDVDGAGLAADGGWIAQ